MDRPSIDGVTTWFVSRAAAEAGLMVVLSGLGGDEVSGGYRWLRSMPNWACLTWRPGHSLVLGALIEQVQAVFATPFSHTSL